MTRQELKALAKQQLGGGIFQNAWVMAAVATLIYALISGASSVIPVVGTLVVLGPLSYGLNYIFLKQARDHKPIQIGDLFKGFTEDFTCNLLIGLMSTIFTALWSILFVIPGIVKAYAYSMAYYIKLDHPEYTWGQCLDQSQVMMKGYKMTLFIQDLSFIGWYLLASFLFYVGILWVQPYQMATRAQFYNALVGWQEPQQYQDPYANRYQAPDANQYQNPYQQANPNPYQYQNPYQQAAPNPQQYQNPYQQAAPNPQQYQNPYQQPTAPNPQQYRNPYDQQDNP